MNYCNTLTINICCRLRVGVAGRRASSSAYTSQPKFQTWSFSRPRKFSCRRHSNADFGHRNVSQLMRVIQEASPVGSTGDAQRISAELFQAVRGQSPTTSDPLNHPPPPAKPPALTPALPIRDSLFDSRHSTPALPTPPYT